jgi:hypothetical protein
MHRLTLIERAYDLADSGMCNGVTEIKKKLSLEGYAAQDLIGKSLLDDLGRRCRVALGKPAKVSPPSPATPQERSERSRKAAASRRANAPPLIIAKLQRP